jgi:hypothetical protein
MNKNINVKKIAKILQVNYRKGLKQLFNNNLRHLETYETYRINKKHRIALLSELENCLSVGNKKPLINEGDFFSLVAPLCLNEYMENTLLKLMKLRVPTLDFISKDLSHLKKNFDGVRLNGNTLFVKTKNIILKDINFGPFEMVFHSDYPIPFCPENIEVEVRALKPNYPPGGGNDYPHPHIEYEYLCIGNGMGPAALALRDMRLFDYFSVVNTVLNTYGAEPHLHIEDWQQNPCNDCGVREHEDEMFYCDYCDDLYCDDCKLKCEECGGNYCAFCSKINCSVCGGSLCEECGYECEVCYEKCCKKCAERSCCGYACADNCCEECECGEIICNSCIKICSECGRSGCKECLCECNSCGDKS